MCKEFFTHLLYIKGVKSMKRKCVVYFSATGKTKKVAEIIAKELKADLYEIMPFTPYTNLDLNWMDKSSRSSQEMNNKEYRPQIRKDDFDFSCYDEILLGFPIWWYVAPTIINTFLESYSFSCEKMILFATSGGSDFGNTVKELKVSYQKGTLIEGKVFKIIKKEGIKEWIYSFIEKEG